MIYVKNGALFEAKKGMERIILFLLINRMING